MAIDTARLGIGILGKLRLALGQLTNEGITGSAGIPSAEAFGTPGSAWLKGNALYLACFGIYDTPPGNDCRLQMMRGVDGINWYAVPGWTYNVFTRDPNLVRLPQGSPAVNKYFVCYTKGGTSNAIGLAESNGVGQAFTFVQNIDCTAVTGIVACYAPTWFIDDDLSIHIVVAIATVPFGPTSGNFQIYELHPTNPADLSAAWSNPLLLTSISIGGVASIIDPFMVKKKGTYYLWFRSVNIAANSENDICYASASSLTGTYTVVKSGDWAGWGNYKEAPILMERLDGSWVIYFDDFENSAITGQINYSISTDDWATWSARQVLPTPSDFPMSYAQGLVKHGGAYRGKEQFLLGVTGIPAP